mgnify:CR=1 FL=1
MTPPAWAQNGIYTAQIDRLVLDGFLKTSGITSDGSFDVSQETPTTMNVVVAAGKAYINGADTTNQGWYHIHNDGDVALNVPGANATNPRIDLVYLKVYDQAFFGTQNLAAIELLTGIPDPSPVAPSVTGTYLPLAHIAVAAGATTITNANITSIVPVAEFRDSLTAQLEVPPEEWRDAIAVGIVAANWTTEIASDIPRIKFRLFNDCVELRGGGRSTAELDGLTGAITSTMLTLPTGYRPAKSVLHEVMIENGLKVSGAASAGTAHTHSINETYRAARVNILTSGVVQLNISHATSAYRWVLPANTWVSLNQVKIPLGLSA